MIFHRFRLFSLCGFQVWVDASWILLGTLVAWTLAEGVFPAALPGLAVATYWWMGVAATIGLSFSLVFHETAHALIARRYNIEIRGITLFIFGGVAEMASEPESARGEFLMALAGPLASLFLAATLSGFVAAIEMLHGSSAMAEVVWQLALLNGMLGIFNLIPAFPLDGGRILRAALWGWRQDIAWATRIAAGAGNAFGIFLIVLGVFTVLRGDFIGGMWQFLIGMFLCGAASASYRQTIAQRLLAGISVAEVMTPDPVSVPPELSAGSFVEDYIYRFHHREFPVTRDGLLIGRIGTKEVAALNRERRAATAVGIAMLPCTAADTIAPEKTASEAMTRMSGFGRGRLFVVRDGRLVGVVSQRDVMELLSAKLELAGEHGAAPAPRRSSDRRAA
jgi:Zn-dependent protease/predicted transcriptional regulator